MNKLDKIEYKKNVLKLFMVCLSNDEKAKKNNIIGDGRRNDFLFNNEALRNNMPEIYLSLLNIKNINEGISYENMSILKSGDSWTDLNLYRDMLLCLGTASKLIEFTKDRKDWSKEDLENPKIKLIDISKK